MTSDAHSHHNGEKSANNVSFSTETLKNEKGKELKSVHKGRLTSVPLIYMLTNQHEGIML